MPDPTDGSEQSEPTIRLPNNSGAPPRRPRLHASGTEKAFPPGFLVGGQFRVIRKLGRGGMGIVYEVHDTVSDQRLALKTIRPDLVSHPGVVEGFIREVNMARRLRHPGIVAVFDIRREGSLLYYTMERVQGETLRDVLQLRGQLPMDETISILSAICDALEHAHEVTVHRDISPENIMITTRGVKILDFGIARALDLHGIEHRAVGKECYAAPEQTGDPRRVDGRADIYALGVVFFEMLTGSVFENAMPPAVGASPISDACRAVLDRSVAPVERRFARVSEFRAALQRCLQASGVPGTRAVEAHSKNAAPQSWPVQGAKAKPKPRSPWIYWVLAILLLGVALALPLLLMMRLASPSPSLPPPSPPGELLLRDSSPIELGPSPGRSGQPVWEEDRREGSIMLSGDIAMDFVRLRLGSFEMGSDGASSSDVRPAHDVFITEEFWIATRPVTQAQWTAVMGSRPWNQRPNVLDHPDAPAVYVSWHDAQRFVDELNALGIGRFRLPTEAEWEYACRAGTQTPYVFHGESAPENLGASIWYSENTRRLGAAHGQPTGQFPANPWGLYDMLGNVAEWCQDWYHPTIYAQRIGAAARNPVGPNTGHQRVIRGGSWNDPARAVAAHSRAKEYPTVANATIGFRICRDP